jgi:type IV pilus assembly protein PilW
MVIGLLIVLSLITLLINVNRNSNEMTKTNRVIENGRFALQLLQANISHAGYWGGFVPAFDNLTTTGIPSDVPTSVPDPCLAFSTPWSAQDKSNLIGIAVQGYEIPAVVPSPTLSVCASRVTNPKANTDVLVVRHVEPCTSGAAAGDCAAREEDALYLQVARCGEVVPAPAYVFNPYALATVAADFPLRNRGSDCATASFAELRKFVSNLYYVRDYAVTPGDGIPTLMRSQFDLSGGVPAHQAPQALIEGIEGFRVEYGVDNVSDSGAAVNFAVAINWADPSNLTSPTNRGNGIPDGNYVRCTTAVPCTVAQLMNTVAVKLYVLVRSENVSAGYIDTKTYDMGSTTLGPFNDGFKRHVFTQTVRLTNVSSRRETP